MEVWGLLIYVLDALVLGMLIKMIIDSRKIEIATRIASRWVLPGLFWVLAAVFYVKYTGVFRYVQSIAMVIMGGIYFTLNTGLSQDGIVMIGRLYKWKKCTPIRVDDKNHSIVATIRKTPCVIPFKEEQMKEVRNFLSKNAGLSKKEVRVKNH